MNTRKHLNILFAITAVCLILCLAATIITFLAMIFGEGSGPFIVCVVMSISVYIGMVFLSAGIDFYDAIVTKSRTYD